MENQDPNQQVGGESTHISAEQTSAEQAAQQSAATAQISVETEMLLMEVLGNDIFQRKCKAYTDLAVKNLRGGNIDETDMARLRELKKIYNDLPKSDAPIVKSSVLVATERAHSQWDYGRMSSILSVMEWAWPRRELLKNPFGDEYHQFILKLDTM